MRAVILATTCFLLASCGGGGATAPISRLAETVPSTPRTPATTPTATAETRTPQPATAAPAPRDVLPTVAPTIPQPAAALTPAGQFSPRELPSAPRQRVGVECLAPVIRRHPIDLAPFDATRDRAGDVQFVRRVMSNRIYTQFGYVLPAAVTSNGQDKPNPQPTYLAPMGTRVRSAVDGVVDRISDLWSTPSYGDVSVMVKPDGLPDGCYAVVEMEHVIHPTVAVGQRVTAGQIIAEVGPLNSLGNSGLGLVEFGLLTGAGNGRPLHACPYAYFAADVAPAQLAALHQLMADWETYTAAPSLWEESSWIGGVVGCSATVITE